VRIAVLAGGLGGSRCVHALAGAAGAANVTAIGNVGDDLEMWDQHVSPDLDTIMYTLAGLLDEERGWGVRGDTYQAMAVAEQAGKETWFTLGDQDAGLHMLRTRLLGNGEPLSSVTQKLAKGLGVEVRLIPATDGWLRTKIRAPGRELDFQEWFVKRRHADRVEGVRFEGAERAQPAPGVLEAIAEADLVVIAPSNPFVSIQPILAVPGIEAALGEKRVAAISPLVGGKALRGPLAEMMASLGHEPSAAGVRALYGKLVSVFVVDREDEALAGEIPGAVVCDTVMVLPERRAEVGREILEAIG
jgi:LPPG:FO 2-phospho-L-lactate transferase